MMRFRELNMTHKQMLNLSVPVTVFTNGQKRDGVICGRTFEEQPRYNVLVAGEVIKDVTADKIVAGVK